MACPRKKGEVKEEQELFNYFMSQKGSLVEGYVFNREDAARRPQSRQEKRGRRLQGVANFSQRQRFHD